jgi:acetolactate synthase-1/2/3 large subunit
VTRTGAQVLVDQLVVHGVETAFCIPGESYIAVLDALHDAPIRLVVARHEAGAANMADAYGKLTGRPGICFVTRAPGATHAAVGVHAAYQDSTPLILFVGQVPRGYRGREAFQELDYGRMFGQMAIWVVEVEAAAVGRRRPRSISRHGPKRRGCRWRPRSAGRTTSTTLRRAMRAC